MPAWVFGSTRAKLVADLDHTVRTLGFSVDLAHLVPVWERRADLVHIVQTAPERAFLTADLYHTVQTLDLSLPDVPLPEPPEGVDEVVPGTRAYAVTHGLPMARVKSFTFDGGDRLPESRLSVQVRGNVDWDADIVVTSTAIPTTGGAPITNVYGPVRVVTPRKRSTPTGTITELSALDTTARDARALATELPELVEWIEHLSPTEQVKKERDQAVRERALSRLPCRERQDVVRGSRRLAVNTLIERILALAPLPVVVTHPLPFGGIYLYEQGGEVVDEATGRKTTDDGGVQPTYDGTKGKSWDAAVLEFLSPFGWEVTLRGGLAYLGPPGDLVEAGGSADALGVPTDAITETGVDELRGGTEGGGAVWWSTTPIPPTGSDELPMWVDVELMPERTHLEPLPPEDPQDATPDPNGTEESRTTTSDEEGVVQTVTTRRTTREAGRIVREEIILDAFVELYPPQFDLTREGTARRWMPGASVTTTTREYAHPRFPDVETRVTKKILAYIGQTNRLELSGLEITENDWSDETGYLRSKVTSVQGLTGIRPLVTLGSNPGYTHALIYGYGSQTETWRPDGGDWWRHTAGGARTLTRGLYDQDLPEYVGTVAIPDASDELDERTQTPPPQARLEERCPEDPPEWQQFPVVSPHVVRFYTGGRGTPTSIRLPWFRAVPAGLLPQFLSRVQPRRRRSFKSSVPLPYIESALRKLRVSGKAGSVTSEVTIDELPPAP